MVIVAGGVKLALLAGDVMLAVGAVLPELTVMLTADDVVIPPALSVAFVVSE